MYITSNLKALRKAKGFTQEEAAEMLNISPQSISKWERGDTYPDITLLPTLANLYKVSVDELIGMDKINDAQEKAAIFKAGHAHLKQEDYNAAAAVFSEALKTYPTDESLMTELGMALALTDDPTKLSQAISLCEKALSGSPSEKVRHTTRAALGFIYLKAGEKDKAVWIAENLPHKRESREEVLSQFKNNPQTEDINKYLRFIILGESDKQDTIVVEFHEDMVPLCFEYDLIGKIGELRKELEALEDAKILPPVRLKDNIHLLPKHVRIRHYADYVFDKPFTDMNVAVNEIIAALRKIMLN